MIIAKIISLFTKNNSRFVRQNSKVKQASTETALSKKKPASRFDSPTGWYYVGDEPPLAWPEEWGPVPEEMFWAPAPGYNDVTLDAPDEWGGPERNEAAKAAEKHLGGLYRL